MREEAHEERWLDERDNNRIRLNNYRQSIVRQEREAIARTIRNRVIEETSGKIFGENAAEAPELSQEESQKSSFDKRAEEMLRIGQQRQEKRKQKKNALRQKPQKQEENNERSLLMKGTEYLLRPKSNSKPKGNKPVESEIESNQEIKAAENPFVKASLHRQKSPTREKEVMSSSKEKELVREKSPQPIPLPIKLDFGESEESSFIRQIRNEHNPKQLNLNSESESNEYILEENFQLDINEKNGLYWIGFRRTGENKHNTRKCVWMTQDDAFKIEEAYREIQNIVIETNQKAIMRVGTGRCLMIKDIYHDKMYYSLRMGYYYANKLEPTKNGFNLTREQMDKLIEKIVIYFNVI